MSDHDICFSIQELSHAKQPKSEVYTQKITEAKSKTFCELLKAADWSQVTASSEPKDAFDKLHSNLEECYNAEIFTFCKVTEELVLKFLGGMQSKCSQGPDGISTKLLKLIIPHILSPLDTLHCTLQRFFSSILPRGTAKCGHK